MNRYFEFIRKTVCEFFEFEESKVLPSSHLRMDLGLDELDLLDLCMEIEAEFDVEISKDVMYQLNTVQDCLDYLEKNV